MQGKKEALLARLEEATLAERGAQQTAGDAKALQKQAAAEEAGNTKMPEEVEKLKVGPPTTLPSRAVREFGVCAQEAHMRHRHSIHACLGLRCWYLCCFILLLQGHNNSSQHHWSLWTGVAHLPLNSQ